MTAYLDALAATAEVGSVVLSDPTGFWVDVARATLGDRLVSTHTEPLAMLASAKPDMAVIAYEAVLAPPIVRAALEVGCHVLAEKPACTAIEAMDELVVLAARQKRKLMLAYA